MEKNLKELYAIKQDNSWGLAIAKFCPNLRKLFYTRNIEDDL